MKENILIVEDEFIVANDLSFILKKADYQVCGIAASVSEAKILVEKYNPSWVLLDIFLQDGSKGMELADYLTSKKIGFLYISANTNQKILEAAKITQPYGFLVKPFREKDLLIMLEIAREKHKQNLEFEQHREAMLQKQINSVIESSLENSEKLDRIPGMFQTLIPFDFIKLNVEKRNEAGADEFSFLRTDFEEYSAFKNSALPESMNLPKKEIASYKPRIPEYAKAVFYNGMEFRRNMFEDTWEGILSTKFELQSKLTYPLMLNNGIQASLSFYSKKSEGYSSAYLNLLKKTEDSIKLLILQTTQKQGAVNTSNASVSAASVHVNMPPPNFDGIVGKSPELLKVLDNISLVSQSELTVLITGESGTGKEKVAHHIHKLSPRKNRPFITINCAALPHALIESELFGHEKGAYTGALEKRIGKFELANGGTIFLDEIGEMPLDAQVKLLRVLQEKEIDHLGGKQAVKIDVRIIAATNRNLEKEVAEGRFRLDLYYRLNVYPIDVPALRTRKEDIPLLASYFLVIFEKDTGRKITGFSQAALEQMNHYNWPGNIRELGHVIQRSMIKANGSVINEIQLPKIGGEGQEIVNENKSKTLEQMEIQHILDVLNNCKGKVYGPGGAAEALGIPPTTLNSKIKKLGIKRGSSFNL
jgi:DNA-binding NtrC family response regulator